MNGPLPTLNLSLQATAYRLCDMAAALYLQEPPGADRRERQEYFDLFFVPVSGRYLPPFESAQREGRLWGAYAHRVAELYAGTGFDFGSLATSPHWAARLPPDHVGVELAFTSLLRQQLEAASPVQRKELETLLSYFQVHHLSRWLPEYGRRLSANACTERYRLLGQLTEYLGRLEADCTDH